MDPDRQIRFLIPPFIFFISILLGAKLDGSTNFHEYILSYSSYGIIALLFAGTTSIVSLGFIISTCSIFFLRLAFRFYGNPTYEIVLSITTQQKIWESLGLEKDYKFDPALIQYTSTTFEHELLPKGIHEWIIRRWSSFNISCHSIFAVIISFLSASLFGIHQSCNWFFYCFIFIILLVTNAYNSWKETMDMMDFQSYRIEEILKK